MYLVIEIKTVKITMINLKLKSNNVKKYFSISLKIEVSVTNALFYKTRQRHYILYILFKIRFIFTSTYTKALMK